MSWNDFNNAEDQEFDVIPKNTVAKIRMSIRPGGYTDMNNGWDNGYAKLSDSSDAVYLDCEFIVLEGPYAKRKIWNLVGLYSPKGPKWTEMGRSFIKGVLHSARGISPKDTSPQAQQARRINSLGELDGIEFVGRIGIEEDGFGDPKNVVKSAVPPDHKDYAAIMNGQSVVQGQTQNVAPPQQQATYTPSQQTHVTAPQRQNAMPSGRPSWAE